MQIKPYKQSFKAQIDDKFLDAADGYYKNSKSATEYKQFCSAIRRFSEMPNTDHITLSIGRFNEDGEARHALYAFDEKNDRFVVLTAKDQFRKLLKKFSFMNEYEFKVKMGMIEKKPTVKPEE